MKQFVFTSNLFPSSADSSFGTFVRRSLEDLQSEFELKGLFTVTERARSIRKAGQYLAKSAGLTAALLKTRVDFVYAHYLTHLTWTLLPFVRRIPIILNAHGYDLIPSSRYQSILSTPNGYLLRHAALVVVPSDYYRDRLLALHPDVDANKVHVNYSCGVDPRCFRPLETRKHFDFLYVSRLDSGKGWELLLTAVRELRNQHPEIRVLVSGHGADADTFVRALKQFKVESNVEYHGPADPHQVPILMNSARYLVFPTARESLGLVAIESLSCGVPVVTFDAPPMNDIVGHMQNGLLFRDYDADSLVSVMRMALEVDAEVYAEISRCAVESTRKYARPELAGELNARIRALV